MTDRGMERIPGVPEPTISDRPDDAPPADYDDAPCDHSQEAP